MFLATHGILRSGGAEAIPYSNTKSIELDGLSDYVDCGNDSSLNLTSQITWSAWVKFNALNNAVNYGIVSNFDPNEGYKYTFVYYPSTTSGSRKLRLRINSSSGSLSGYYDTSVDLSDNQWHHVAFSFDGTTNANGIKVYVDGINVNSFTSSNSGIFSSSGSTLIGAYQTSSWFANANIDEVSLFNTELSVSDITTIYNSGVPNDISSLSPLSWWRCGDGDTAPILNDNGSGGNDGTMTNFSTFSTDVPTFSKRSIALDGVNDYVDIGNPSNLSSITSISISAWFKTTDTVGGLVLVGSDSNTQGRRYVLRTHNSSGIKLRFFSFSANGVYKDIIGTTNINDGQWHHVLAINNGTNLKIYVDGVLDNSNNDGNLINTTFATPNINIGRRSYSGVEGYFDGSIDEVAIWSNDQSENASAIGGTIPTDLTAYNPLGYWRFEGSGTTATDSGSGGNNGTLINGVTRSTDVP